MTKLDEILDPIFEELESEAITVIGEFSTNIKADEEAKKLEIADTKAQAKTQLLQLLSDSMDSLIGPDLVDETKPGEKINKVEYLKWIAVRNSEKADARQRKESIMEEL